MKNIIALLLPIFLFAASLYAAAVKKAELAGTWYPGSRQELSSLIDSYLKAADPERIEGDVFALISPHAGYRFSAPVAAYGFKALEGRDIKTVIIIGFSHRKFFDGISVYADGAFETPLGSVDVDDRFATELISKSSRMSFEPALFSEENSVETQIPFIQTVFKNAKIVPIAFGSQNFSDARTLADALADTLKDRQGCLIVASTDLSHYHPYREANSIDAHTIGLLKPGKAKELCDEVSLGVSELCGSLPVAATLMAAEKCGFEGVKILKYANSGDTCGDKTRVVGYVSAVVYRVQRTAYSVLRKEKSAQGKEGESRMLSDTQRKRLLQIARESITSFVKSGERKRFEEKDPLLNRPMGAFVTLHENDQLRGCIGNMVGRGPLYSTVAAMAIEAATGDPRFPALSPAEIDRIDIEISVLSPLEKVASYRDIKIPGQGVIVKSAFGGGVYLPQVATETGWTREEFLTSLCGQKAGISPDAWKDPDTELYVFTAEVFGEKEFSR
jgi:AmmeMemoRadiSam system protein B/AmmeMemoRadiSam system protein A